MSRARQELTFHPTGEPRVPYEAIVDGERWTVRINEFPEAPSLYSLLIDERVVEELMAWPSTWKRLDLPPPPGGEDPYEQAEHDRAQAHFERTRSIKPSKLVE